ERPPGQLQGGPSRRQIDHAHVAPEDAGAHACAQRLGAGLLGREALGVGLRLPRPPVCPGALDRGEDPGEKAVAVARDHLLDPPHIDEVGADAENHRTAARARPRSMAVRMMVTACPSPVETASPTRKWPMLSSTTCGSAAMVSAVT